VVSQVKNHNNTAYVSHALGDLFRISLNLFLIRNFPIFSQKNALNVTIKITSFLRLFFYHVSA
jgi:hypothetical protein